jgi:hypothetical protein
MLYLDSIVFTMQRDWCCKKTREALCTAMAEYPSSHRALSQRKGTAVRPPIDRCHGARLVSGPGHIRWGHFLRVLFLPSQLPPSAVSSAFLSSSPATARKSFESPQLIAVAGCRSPFMPRADEPASLNASAPISALQKLNLDNFNAGHAATSRVATPP